MRAIHAGKELLDLDARVAAHAIYILTENSAESNLRAGMRPVRNHKFFASAAVNDFDVWFLGVEQSEDPIVKVHATPSYHAKGTESNPYATRVSNVDSVSL
jgi:hypothetical protein